MEGPQSQTTKRKRRCLHCNQSDDSIQECRLAEERERKKNKTIKLLKQSLKAAKDYGKQCEMKAKTDLNVLQEALIKQQQTEYVLRDEICCKSNVADIETNELNDCITASEQRMKTKLKDLREQLEAANEARINALEKLAMLEAENQLLLESKSYLLDEMNIALDAATQRKTEGDNMVEHNDIVIMKEKHETMKKELTYTAHLMKEAEDDRDAAREIADLLAAEVESVKQNMRDEIDILRNHITLLKQDKLVLQRRIDGGETEQLTLIKNLETEKENIGKCHLRGQEPKLLRKLERPEKKSALVKGSKKCFSSSPLLLHRGSLKIHQSVSDDLNPNIDDVTKKTMSQVPSTDCPDGSCSDMRNLLNCTLKHNQELKEKYQQFVAEIFKIVAGVKEVEQPDILANVDEGEWQHCALQQLQEFSNLFRSQQEEISRANSELLYVQQNYDRAMKVERANADKEISNIRSSMADMELDNRHTTELLACLQDETNERKKEISEWRHRYEALHQKLSQCRTFTNAANTKAMIVESQLLTEIGKRSDVEDHACALAMQVSTLHKNFAEIATATEGKIKNLEEIASCCKSAVAAAETEAAIATSRLSPFKLKWSEIEIGMSKSLEREKVLSEGLKFVASLWKAAEIERDSLKGQLTSLERNESRCIEGINLLNERLLELYKISQAVGSLLMEKLNFHDGVLKEMELAHKEAITAVASIYENEVSISKESQCQMQSELESIVKEKKDLINELNMRDATIARLSLELNEFKTNLKLEEKCVKSTNKLVSCVSDSTNERRQGTSIYECNIDACVQETLQEIFEQHSQRIRLHKIISGYYMLGNDSIKVKVTQDRRVLVHIGRGFEDLYKYLLNFLNV